MTATQWLETALSFSLQVFVVILVSGLLERSIFKPADRCAVWNSCFVGILFLALTGMLLPRLHLLRPWSLVEPHTLIALSSMESYIAKLLLLVWCVGASIALFSWLIRAVLLRRTLNRCQPLSPHRVEELLDARTAACLAASNHRLLVSDDVDGPFCLQLHRPVIVLPRILLDGAADDLRHVLYHELAHLQANHPLQLFLQHLAQIVCWFHPALTRASSRASLMREYSCDDAVMVQGVKCAAYLRTLLHIAERSDAATRPSTIGFGKSATELVLRAKRLVELAKRKQETHHGRQVRRGAAIATIAVVTALMSLVSVPSDPVASSRSAWSAWPTWTAQCLHCVGVPVRDYELFDRRVRPYEQLYDNGANDTVRFDARADDVGSVN